MKTLTPEIPANDKDKKRGKCRVVVIKNEAARAVFAGQGIQLASNKD